MTLNPDDYTETDNLGLIKPKPGTLKNVWDQPVNENFDKLDSKFSVDIAGGGHSHSGVAGEGPQLDHEDLINSGTNTHAQIDSHIASTALHSDTKISTVKGVDSDVNLTTSNIQELRFANSTVSLISSGVVLVTPKITAISTTTLNTEAPSVFVDNFNRASGTALPSDLWLSLSQATNDAQFLHSAPAGTDTSASLVLDLSAKTGPASGINLCHVKSFVPKSIVQRASVSVSSVSQSDLSAIATDDEFTLSIDLVSASELGTLSRPNSWGMSLLITKATGVDTLSYSFDLKDSATGQSYVWSNFTGSFFSQFANQYGTLFNNLPLEYIVGSHELSIGKVDNTDEDVYAAYYYNGGLVYRKTFSIDSTVPEEADFAAALNNLLSNLSSSVLPTYPTFGSTGFSFSYNVSDSTDLVAKISGFACSSVGDWSVPRLVSIPTTTEISPPDVPVCSSGPFSDVFIGDVLDFDGPLTTNTQFTVQTTFSDVGGGAGFYVTDSSGSVVGSFPVYCSAPVVSGAIPQSYIEPLSTTGLNNSFILYGDQLPSGTLQQVDVAIRFADNTVPTNTYFPNGSFFEAGAEVPPTILGITSLVWGTAVTGESYILGTYYSAGLIPVGARFDITITPKLDTAPFDHSATWSNAFEVVANDPNKLAAIGFPMKTSYAKFDGSTNTWTALTPSSVVTEGDTVFFLITGAGLPLGSGFHSTTNNYVGWTIPLANTDETIYTIQPAGFQTLTNSNFYPYANLTPPSVAVTGSTINTSSINTATTLGGPFEFYNLVSGFIKVHANQWEQTNSSKGVKLTITNPSSGTSWSASAFDIVLPQQVGPAKPVITSAPVTLVTGSSITTSGTQFNVVFTVRNADEDVQVELASGLTHTSGTVLTSGAGITIANTPTIAQKIITVNGLTVSGASGTAISLRIKNKAAFLDTQFGGNAGNVALYTFGTIATNDTPQFKPGQSFTLNIDEANSINVLVSLTAAIPTLTFVPPSGSGGIDSSAFASFTAPLPNATYDSETLDVDNYVIWPINILVNGDGTPPEQISMWVTTPNGSYDELVFDVENPSALVLLSVKVGAPDGPSTWDISGPVQQKLYFATSGAKVNSSINAVSRLQYVNGTWTEINPGTLYSAVFTRSSSVTSGQRVSFVISNPVEGSEAVTYTKSDAVEFNFTPKIHATIAAPRESVGTVDRRSNSGLLSENTLVNGTQFATTPTTGHYSTFVINGVFAPTNSSGSNLTVDFKDAATNSSLTSAVTVTNATASAITGVAKFANNLDGRRVVTSITHIDLSKTTTEKTGVTVRAPIAPTVTSTTIIPPNAGSSNAVITIRGANLIPDSAPSGVTALSYVYTFFNSGTGTVLSSITAQSSSKTQLVFRANIASDAAGKTVGLAINYLGGKTARYPRLFTVKSAEAGDPTITDLVLYTATDDPDANPAAPIVYPDGYAYLRITGTNLSSINIDDGTGAEPFGVSLEVVGEENISVPSGFGAVKETAPGPGRSESQAERLQVLEVISAGSSQIIVKVPATPDLAYARARVWLTRPSSHSLGAGDWDLAIVDETDVGNGLGLTALGTTVRYGPARRDPRLNNDSTSGITQLDVARSLQSQCGEGTEGDAFSISVRLAAAIVTADPPEVIAVADATYGVKFTNVASAKTGDPFVITVTGNVPVPGTNNTYPDPSFSIDTPVICGLRFANGHVIAAATLGTDDWGDNTSYISF